MEREFRAREGLEQTGTQVTKVKIFTHFNVYICLQLDKTAEYVNVMATGTTGGIAVVQVQNKTLRPRLYWIESESESDIAFERVHRSQFNVHIKERQRSKKNSFSRSLALSENEP